MTNKNHTKTLLLDDHAERIRTVWLDISSWKGISLGAVHFYGAFHPGYDRDYAESVDVQRTLTASEARDLSKIQNDNSLFGLVHRYRKGDLTRYFDDREKIIAQAKKAWRDLFPNHVRLVLGSICRVEHQEVLDSRDDA